MKAITLKDYKQRLLPVLIHIQHRLDEPLRLETLAALAHFSPFHFHRVFRGMVGESLHDHIRRLRLERAASQLIRSRSPVTEIALDAGYESHEAFTRAFKSTFGSSPTHFRALRQSAELKTLTHAPSGVHYINGRPLRRFKTMPVDRSKEPITVKSIPPRRVGFVRHTGPYHLCGEAWEKLCAYLGKEGMLGGSNLFIGLCHDDPEVTPQSKIRYDACVTVDAKFRPQDDIGVQTIAGGDYAVTTHFGPYERLNDTYARVLGQWLPRSGRELGSGPSFEVYHNDPNSTDPEDLVTEVHVPLK